MYNRRFRPPSKPTIFLILMLASAVLLLLPSDPLTPARDITSLIAIPQYLVRETAQRVTHRVESLADKPVTADRYAEVLQEKQAVENENAALRQSVVELLATQEHLMHLMDISQEWTLVPAHVVAWDAVPGRDSLQLNKGRSSKVESMDWVVSRLQVDVGTKGGISDRSEVLPRECLIGWVEHAGLWSSRVVLLSDPEVNKAMRVYIEPSSGRQDHKSGRQAPLILEGAGQGKMLIRDIPADLVTNGLVRVGDLVNSDRNDTRLPVAMVIGTISELKQNREDNVPPLFYEAVVEHRYDPKKLSLVFIVARDAPQSDE
ncbi:MAG: rod shape-determining protein MreC [Planctomycetota bacterium]|jgi:cell shape-determining protein MreC